MRTSHPTIVYTSARVVLFLVVLLLLSLTGLGGLMLWALAFVVSALISYVVLSRQRDAMSGVLSRRLASKRERGTGLRARLEAGATMEDEDDELEATDRGAGHTGPASAGTTR